MPCDVAMTSSSTVMSSAPSRNCSIHGHTRRRPSTARLRRVSNHESRTPLCEQAARHLMASSLSSPAPKLAKLRVAVLDHLKEVETHLSQLESPLREMRNKSKGDGDSQPLQAHAKRERSESLSTIDEARARVHDGLEMLGRIRSDVCSHLPDLSGLDFLPDITLDDVRSHMPSFEFPELDLHLPSTPSFDDVSFNLDKLHHPLLYVPMLKKHLESLHEHIRSLQLPSSLSLNCVMPSPNGRISELLYKLQDPDLLTDPLRSPRDFLGDSHKAFENEDETFEDKTILWKRQTDHALVKSHQGTRLIMFQDLPHRYQNDEYVLTGYRFIPLFRWPLLALSAFRLHNETANIWTHLIPLLFSLVASSSTPFLESADLPERVFVLFANICLASSCVWHIMSGCADLKVMETAARVDYVGIGWLISASIGSVMYYGFGCHPRTAALYLSISFALGVTGSILPFMTFFNERQNKKWRIMFFLSLVFTLIFPLAHLAALHSLWDMYTFMRPEFPSLAAYTIGLVFYAFHFPECAIPTGWTECTDWVGGGSHAIWHLFIVLAIKLHKDAMIEYRGGIGGEVCTLSWSRDV